MSWEDSVARAVARYGEIIEAKKLGELPPPAASKTAPDEQAIRLIAASFKPYAKIKDTGRKLRQAAADREAAYFAYEDPAEHEWFARQVIEEHRQEEAEDTEETEVAEVTEVTENLEAAENHEAAEIRKDSETPQDVETKE
ncbi:MAG: hypothetical protein J6V10_06295 [Clostridia bacterium]|nr:hypothetical protein [Clostridia bacterium]